MCSYPHSDHALPHWKCVMQCCAKFPCVNLPDQETNDQYSDTIPSILFHIYHLIARFTTHGRLPLNDKKVVVSVNRIMLQKQSTKIYTRKYLVMMEKTISKFSFKFLYYRNSEVGVLHSTCTNTGYKSLW